MTTFEVILLLIGTFLAINSYLFVFFGDHPLFGLTENLYIGGFVAYGLHSLQKSLQTTCFEPILRGQYSLIIAVIIGLTTFTRLTRWRWAARYSVCVLSGIGLGVLVGLTIRTQLLNPISTTISNLLVGKPDPVSAAIMFVSFISVLIYFLYTVRFSNTFYTGRLKPVMKITRLFLYAGVGYLFVSGGGAGGGAGSWFVYYIRRTYEALAEFLVVK